MSCSYAKELSCSVTGDRCMFLTPNSKNCAEIYGEGPDAVKDRCEDCRDFYYEDGKRCCKTKPFQPVWEGDPPKTPYLDNETVCCGGFKRA